MEERESQFGDWPTEMSKNVHGEWEFGDILGAFVSALIQDIAFLLEEIGRGEVGGEGGAGAGVDFQNEVFEMHPYHWGRCTCGAGTAPHQEICSIKRPNFRCQGLELRWYHSIGPGMVANRTVSRHEIRQIHRACIDSLLGGPIGKKR